MTTHYGGSYIHVYLCPNHPNERWDVQMMIDEKPLFCLACEIKRLRAVEKFCLDHIRMLQKENKELKEKAI